MRTLRNEFMSDHCSYTHNLGSCEIKVEHCTGIAEVVGSPIPFRPEFFSGFFFHNCLSCLCNYECDDQS